MSNEQRDHDFVHALAPRPRTQTELTRRNRVLSFSDAHIAVKWLNATMRTAAYRRVIGIRAQMAYLDDMLQQRKGQQRIDGEFRLRLNLLNQRLSRYTFTPVLVCDPNTGIWRYNAVPKAIRGPVVEVSDGSLTVQVNESAVVAALARLAANRELYKVRLCEQCHEQWRVSDRKMDRFCSSECREKFRMSQPESRERHARQQREYRQAVKSHPPRNERN